VRSPGRPWRIAKIARSAEKTLRTLEASRLSGILSELEALQTDPFSGDLKKVKGKRDIFRRRFEGYRIYFRLCPEMRSIDILLIDIRGDIKDRTIQKL
jgi:mRNA-degrading endonuclease RelE of RelBE toxin-antitoxin system